MTNDMTTNAERARFESWLESRGGNSGKYADGRYLSPNAALAWEAWKTALITMNALSQSQQGRGLPDLPDDFSSSKDWRHGNYAERVEWLMVMVRSLGEQLDAVGAALAAQQGATIAGPSEPAPVADAMRELSGDLRESAAFCGETEYGQGARDALNAAAAKLDAILDAQARGGGS